MGNESVITALSAHSDSSIVIQKELQKPCFRLSEYNLVNTIQRSLNITQINLIVGETKTTEIFLWVSSMGINV